MTQSITINELHDMLSKKVDCQLIDVREIPEYKAVRISGAKIVPLSTIQEDYKRIQKDKPVYIHCGVGKRAERAREFLAQSGFKDLYVVEGGIKAWIEAGLPVECG